MISEKLNQAIKLMDSKKFHDAESLLKELSNTGYPEADFYLAELYSELSKSKEEEARAVEYYKRAAKKGSLKAKWVLAGILSDSGNLEASHRNYMEVIQQYKNLAGQGDTHAKIQLGWIYSNGEGGIQPNRVEAITYLRSAVDDNCPRAMFDLAELLFEFDSTLNEFNEGKRLLIKSAESGLADAQYSLATAYASDKRMPINLQKAIYWYQKAHENGMSQATLNLGLMILKGEGCDQDKSKAMEILQQAAESGSLEALNLIEKIKD